MNWRCAAWTATAAENWKKDVGVTRALGDGWLAAGDAAPARVSSAIVPETWNCLLNPEHPDAGRLGAVTATRERFDLRLFQAGAH